jgi:hypothetical protein
MFYVFVHQLVFIYWPVILFGNLAYETLSLILKCGTVEQEVIHSLACATVKGTPGILFFQIEVSRPWSFHAPSGMP